MNINENLVKNLINTQLKQIEDKYGKEVIDTILTIISLENIANNNTTHQKAPIPLASWNKYHDYPSVNALRQYYFYKDRNGFEECVEYGGENGGRILINEDKFFEWQRQRKKKAS